MEGEIKNKQNKSEKIISTICDPATQEKKNVELSPGNNESKKKFKSQKSILKKESRAYSGVPKNDKSLGIKWDNKAIY